MISHRFYSGYECMELTPSGPVVTTSVYSWIDKGFCRFVDMIGGTIWQRGSSQSMCRRWAKANADRMVRQ